jgi:hypothetical protein
MNCKQMLLRLVSGLQRNGVFLPLIKATFLLAIISLCLFEFVLHRQGGIIYEFETSLLQMQLVLLVCFAVWCGSLLFVTFRLNDLPIIGLLLIALTAYCISILESQSATNAVTLLAGVTLGKGALVLLSCSIRHESASTEEPETGDQKSNCGQNGLTSSGSFLIGLIVLLAFASWWRLDMSANDYRGPRWMGLWNNPNIYGMLMGTGLVLAIELLAGRQKAEGKRRKATSAVLSIAAGMITVGLVFSYSRGAWTGTAVGLLYLARVHGTFKWRSVLRGVFVVAVAVLFTWHSTMDTDQWYLKRLDLSRPSAQNRVAAWWGAFQMMRDHPLGVGLNQAVAVYKTRYSPPEGGALAITTNSYLMLGTELGLPGLLCFMAYVGLCFRNALHPTGAHSHRSESGEGVKIACRAGALVLLVAFWFDGGLFEMATASVFWVLLELGSVQTRKTTASRL